MAVVSALRLIGLAVGVVLIVLAVLIGRRGANRSLMGLLLLVGSGLLILSVFPDVVAPLRDLLGLSESPTGRLMTVLIASVALAFILILLLFSRLDRVNQRLGRLIRALSAAQLELEQAGGRLGGVLVVVPAYNEAESLPDVLREIPAVAGGLATHVLVVDDASTDGTRAVAVRHGAHVVSHPVNAGQGAALQTGYLIAERVGVDVVVTLDADGQHDPLEMERLIEPIAAGHADFVVGSRRTGSFEREAGVDGFARHAGISLYTRLVNLLGATDLSDVANGYRAIRADRLAAIVFTEEQFHNPELLMGAARAGLRINEVPITIRRRSAGTSKKGGTIRYGFGFLRVVIRSWLR